MNKILILTNKESITGRSLLSFCIKEKLLIEEIILIEQNFKYYIKLFKFVLKRVGIFDAIIFSFIKLISDYIHDKFFCPLDNIKNIIQKNNLKFKLFKADERLQSNLSKYIDTKRSKIILIGQTGILGKELNLIRNDRLFINCHPGELPNYRGIDSFKWAILENKINSLKTTIHIVRDKIDSGEILNEESYDYKKLSWFFCDRQLLIIAGNHLGKYIKKMSSKNSLREELLDKAISQKSNNLRFKMSLNKEIKAFINFQFLKRS